MRIKIKEYTYNLGQIKWSGKIHFKKEIRRNILRNTVDYPNRLYVLKVKRGLEGNRRQKHNRNCTCE